MKRARVEWRSVVDEADPLRFAAWVRELQGRSGAYAIRDAGDQEILYVGESHTGRLRGTLTRHFQAWTGYQAGTLYSRHGVEVALFALDAPAREVIDAQATLIRELGPRDNVHHQRRGDDEADFDPSEFADVW
ncbi:MAG: hypothetical protein K8H88_32020 [Sandaracinaceae bacterium]|nr:hypothetical protein [Sandaracinaceae bacterium]